MTNTVPRRPVHEKLRLNCPSKGDASDQIITTENNLTFTDFTDRTNTDFRKPSHVNMPHNNSRNNNNVPHNIHINTIAPESFLRLKEQPNIFVEELNMTYQPYSERSEVNFLVQEEFRSPAGQAE